MKQQSGPRIVGGGGVGFRWGLGFKGVKGVGQFAVAPHSEAGVVVQLPFVDLSARFP